MAHVGYRVEALHRWEARSAQNSFFWRMPARLLRHRDCSPIEDRADRAGRTLLAAAHRLDGMRALRLIADAPQCPCRSLDPSAPAIPTPRPQCRRCARGARGRPFGAGARPCGRRARVADRGRAASQGRAGGGARAGRAPAARRPPRAAVRRAAVPAAGRDHRRAVRVRAACISIRRTIRRKPSAWRWSRPAATAAACWRPVPTSTCCSCCPTSRPRGANRSPRPSSTACGTWGSRSATPRARSTNACGRPRPT